MDFKLISFLAMCFGWSHAVVLELFSEQGCNMDVTGATSWSQNTWDKYVHCWRKDLKYL